MVDEDTKDDASVSDDMIDALAEEVFDEEEDGIDAGIEEE